MKRLNKLGDKLKGDHDGDDPNRSALFSSKKSRSPAPQSSNPYAQPTGAPDPYTQAKMDVGDPYTRAKMNLAGGGGLPSSPRGGGPPVNAPPPYGGPPGQGYGADNKYGAPQDSYGGSGGGYGGQRGGAGGYGGYGGGAGDRGDRYGGGGGGGGDRYGGGGTGGGGGAGYGSNSYGGYQSQGNPSGASRYGPGGYGGLGRTTSNDTTTTDDNREALFGGAKQRFEQQAQPSGLPPGHNEDSSQGDGGYGDSNQGNYGAYQDRQLTAEEEEEEDISGTKQEVRFIKQQDVSSTRNAIRIAAEAEETGRNTLARLGAQGERIHNTEKNLDLAANQNRTAEAKARELKTLNKSMFAVHVANPFTGAARRGKRDEAILNRHQDERDERDRSRQAAFESNARMDKKFRDIQSSGGAPGSQQKASLAERAKYQFEADSEDDEMENEIDGNLDALTGAAGRLNMLARATGEEIEAQNKHLDRITGKSDRVDDQIHMNRARLDRIH